jgi:hypothetical protein
MLKNILLAALFGHHGATILPQSQLKLDKPNQVSASGGDPNTDNSDWIL